MLYTNDVGCNVGGESGSEENDIGDKHMLVWQFLLLMAYDCLITIVWHCNLSIVYY